MHAHRPLRFEDLESRQLLTAAHVSVVKTIHAAVVAPLVLDGTLKVNEPLAMVMQNLDGSWTKTTPVSGTLLGTGQVHGVWVNNVDAYGDQLDPSRLELRGPNGSFDVSFSAASLAKPAHNADGTTSFETSQHVRGGSGAFAHATESGTILVRSAVKHNTIATMALASN